MAAVEKESLASPPIGPQRFPFRVFWGVLSFICLALLLSAVHTYTTLNDLRAEFLRNRAHDVVSAVEQQTRGPGRRFNVQIWQQALQDAVERYPETVAFIALVDGAGHELARAGDESGDDFYILQIELESGRGRGPGAMSADWRIKIALYQAQAEFIVQQAKIHAFIASVAIVTLLGLGFYFVKTLNRFLTLRNREESEKHLAALGAMSATLAHEIRNPLGAMKGLTQVVQEDFPPGHRSHELMKTVVREAERLEQLVTDLLTFARPSELKLTHLNLVETVKEVSSFLAPQADAAGVTVHVGDEPSTLMVYSDPAGLKQILLNLIINAVEFSPRNGQINITLTHEPRKGQATVTILDQGPGIGDATSEELFQPFKTTKLKGSGLGLAVSNQIAQRLGGTISLENADGAGTVCRLQIPVDSRTR